MQLAQTCLDIVKNIPENEFIINEFTDEVSKCCVLGHINRISNKRPHDYSYLNCWSSPVGDKIYEESRKFINAKYVGAGLLDNIAGVNNGNSISIYNQDTPKQRVMALLNEMINN